MENAPLALEFAPPQGRHRQLGFFLSGPGREDSYSQTEFHQLLDCFDAAQLHYRIEHHLLLLEMFLPIQT